MNNLFKKLAKGTGKGLALLAAPLLIGGCSPKGPPTFEGKIIVTSFYPDPGGFGGADRYTALIETSWGDTIKVEDFNSEARESNLKYREGDKVYGEITYNAYGDPIDCKINGKK